MKIISAILLAIALAAATPVQAQKIDLNTVKCKEFIESSSEKIGFIMMWLSGYYMDEDDPPVIDFDKMKADGAKLGDYCRANPTNGLITASEEIMG